MGTVRTLLAIAVVFSHCYGFMFVGGRLAVQMFYAISGFLISYILIEARAYATARSFYANRCLRLFPIYWLVAAVALAMNGLEYAVTGSNAWLGVLRDIDPLGRIALLVSNVTLFGQDWIMFTAVHDGAIGLSTNFRESEIEVWKGLLVPQAWTLGVELSFYLVAPLILHRRVLLIGLLLGSLVLRGVLIKLGFGGIDPWTYRFFPTELALFLIGALSHQLLAPRYARLPATRLDRASVVATAGIGVYIAVFAALPMRSLQTLLLLGGFVLVLPLLFRFQSRHRWDRWIGELSYPIYIAHLAVIFPLERLLPRFGIADQTLASALIVVATTIVVAHLLNRIVGARIERMRDRFRSRQPARAQD